MPVYDDAAADGARQVDPDEALLAEIREYFDYDTQNWADIRREADKDVQYACGNTWEPDDVALRAGRPMVNLDQLSQYLNQLENTVRQNKRAVKVSPAGGGATKETGELRSNRIREIEYQSHAQEAYIQAFSSCAMRSYGFARIVAEYEDETSTNQVLRLKAIANPDQVLPDSDAESTSGRDWTRCFFVRTVSRSEFKRDWPHAQVVDFLPEHIAIASKWITSDRVQIAEYWRVTETPNPNGGRPTREVCQYLTNGLELLDPPGSKEKGTAASRKTIWKGRYIPFASCYGKIIYRTSAIGESTKVMLSYIRLARDAAKGYNWTASTELEALAMPIKAALMGYKGQADPEAIALIERAAHEPIAWIEFAAQTEATGTAVLPLPQYGMRAPDISGYEIARESFRRDVQNALGRYSTGDHRLGSTKVTSGVALRELDKSGDLGSYHFIDHYDDMIMFLGEQLDDLLRFYDDTDKEIAVRLPDGTPKLQRINRMTGRGPNGAPAYGPGDLRMDQGRHTITISTGPNFDSQREAAKDAATNLLANPQAFPYVASDAVRLLDLGPIGDQMADDLEFLQPPAMQEARQREQKDGAPPDPKQLLLQLSKMKQQLHKAEEIMQQAGQELQSKQAELDSKEKIAAETLAANHTLQIKLQEMKNATTIAVAHITANAKGAAIDAHADEEAIALGVELEQQQQARDHELAMAAAGAGAQADEAEAGRAHASAEAQAGRDHAAQMGDQSHQQTLEQQQQAADLAPAPGADATV